MLTEYIEAAMRRAKYHQLANGTYFAEIPGFEGVWASGDAPEAAVSELREVLEEWIVLGLQRNDPMPEVDGLTLTFREVA